MAGNDRYDAARKVIPSIKAGREHAAYEIGLSEGRKQSRDELAALRAELEESRRHTLAMFGKLGAAEAEVERMRRVVGNALEWRDNWPARNAMQWDYGCEADLCAAVDAYRAGEQEVSDD